MPKRSYRKKSGKGKKGSRKGSKRSYRKKGSRKGSKRSYRKKGSRKGSKKSYRKKGSRKGSKKTSKRGSKKSKRCPKGEVRTMRKLANGKLGVGKCMPKPFGAKKVEAEVKEEKKDLDKAEVVLDKKEERLEDAIIAGAPAPVIAELKEEVKDAKEEVKEKLENLEKKVEEAKDLLGVGVFGDFSEPVEGVFGNIFPEFQRIRRRIKGSKRGRKSRGKSRKTSRGKKSRGKKSRRHSKRHSKRRHSKRKGSKRY